MDEPLDLLQIKIGAARRKLAPETVEAVDAVDWKAAIAGFRQSKGFSFEQLGDLETETELLLSGLTSSKDYPSELEARMKIPRAQLDDLLKEMDKLVFARIRQEFIKITERISKVGRNEPTTEDRKNPTIPVKAYVPEIQTAKADLSMPELMPPHETTTGKVVSGIVPSILEQKLSGSFKSNIVTTEHTLGNISKGEQTKPMSPLNIPKIVPMKPAPVIKTMADIKPAGEPRTTVYAKGDPYRLSPEE